MNNKQRKNLPRIMHGEAGNNIRWADVESLFVGLGAVLDEGAGSRVTVTMGEHVAVAVRRFLNEVGVEL